MMFTSKSLITLFALAPAAFAIPGPSWYRRQEDAQTSLTLDPAVISPGLAQDGQGNNPDPGQVRSLTSRNNFINFCLTQNAPLTDGQQKIEGSCNPTPMGRIISLDVSPASKFVFPKNTDSSIQPNQAFTIQMKVRNMQLGNFVNAQSNYYAAPQQVNGQGIVIGHTHVVIEAIPSFDSTEPLDPLTFEFFKGVNGAADGNGIVSVAVDKGVKAGFYRLCSINTAANHQPVIVSNAQHGGLDDCVYFAVGQGDDPFKLKGGNTADASASVSASVSESASVSASVSASASASESAAATATASESAVSSDSVTASATVSAPAVTESADAGQNGNQQNGGNGNNQNDNQNNNNGGNNNGGNNGDGAQNGGNNNDDNANNNQQQGGNDQANNQQGGNDQANNQQNGNDQANNQQNGNDQANNQQNGNDQANNQQNGNGNADATQGNNDQQDNTDNQQGNGNANNGNADAQGGNGENNGNADAQGGNGGNNGNADAQGGNGGNNNNQNQDGGNNNNNNNNNNN